MTTHLWHISDIANILRALSVNRGPLDDYARGRMDALSDVAVALGIELDDTPAVWIVRGNGKHVAATLELPSLIVEE